jgi:hypothetical protein
MAPQYDILLAIIVIAILIFLLIRNIVCWYWKINLSIKNQKEIIRLLKKIAGEEQIDDKEGFTPR